MKILRLAVTAAAALALTLVGVGAAQAYPSPVFNMNLSNQAVVGGHSLTVTVKASVKCTLWEMRFNGHTAHTSNSSSFTHTFATPVVKHKTVRQVTAQCTYSSAAGAAGHSIRITQATSPVLRSSVTLLPASEQTGAAAGQHNSAAGGLPNTGGPDLWILIAALALLGGGGIAMARSRRRTSADSDSANPGVAG